MSHPDLPPPSNWYGEMMQDDARLGPAAAEALWFPRMLREHELAAMQGFSGEKVNSGWTGALIEAVVDKREYMLLTQSPNYRPPKSLGQLWRDAVAENKRDQP